jgi:ATP-dependent exoDNAse (exonuclease V) beta subunit
MTMHKAKGLELDTVILPGLGKRPHGRDASLLASLDVILPSGEQGTILAPMAAVGEQQDRLYDYLAAVERRKQAAETRRLLYVACTRAKTSLHVLAHATVIPDDADGWCLRKPDAGSLLECLWPVLAAEAPIHPPESGAADTRKSERTWIQPLIRRLPPQWQAPPAAPALAAPASETLAQTEKLAYEWVSNWAMCAGSVVHYWLKVMTEKGVDDFSARRIRADRPLFRRQLISLGISTDDLERATDRVVDALLGAIADERGRWILSAAHAQSQCELPLTTLHNGRFRNVVIDRTFVAPDGYRWLIDYKISSHEGGDLAAFLVQEAARHAEQLRTYRQALTALWNEPVRSALYFPLLGEFVEVSLDDVAG